ncbi:MAG: hypothetical protein IPH13_00755 [Planctomycetes bacterium]|nr:hypothetical protein [Planctomycetota bacterium]
MLNLRNRALTALAIVVTVASSAAFATPEPAEAVVAPRKPLRVYVLAGQSNMQGHAEIRTFDSMATDPKTAPLLADMRTRNGKARCASACGSRRSAVSVMRTRTCRKPRAS